MTEIKKPSDYFMACMELVQDIEIGARVSDDGEKFADKQLLVAANCAMALNLDRSASKGKKGWWDDNVCSVEGLRGLRDQALKDDDHVSVLNYTAMIAMREASRKSLL